MVKLRPRKCKMIIVDDSDDESYDLPKEAVLRTPKKDKIKLNEAVTPPKQQKICHSSTPEQKINENKNCHTPSTLLENLTLVSPKKNKLRNNRKTLFETANENSVSTITKNNNENCAIENDNELGVCDLNNKSESEENVKTNSYRNARKALHSSLPSSLPGRETQLEELRTFITDHIESDKPASMYISGPPGTGKTASLSIVLEEESVSNRIRQVYVNCTAIKSPTAIYGRIVKELSIKVSGKTEKDYIHGIENYLKKSKKMTLMVLDEIDQLENKTQSILYTIFEWPSKKDFKLILIGIANALDLTDRTLPRLQAKCELKPKLMHFAPYTKHQLVDIFTNRLKEAGALEVFSANAMQILAGKVAAVSGDVRRALDIGRRVIEMIDNNRGSDSLKAIENIANDIVHQEEKALKKVDLKEVLDVLNNVYGTSQTLTEDAEDAFPLQQKIVICSLLLMLRKAKSKDITVGKLHEVYKRICNKRNILAVDQSEFVGICSLIETRGMIRISGKKETRLSKVHLEWDEEEVSATLRDKKLMSQILQDVSCLDKF